ncbi:hypothetical protein GLOIN_2v1476994 [Rhizophagus irregularis DAOM 181602=DAOM 197198]|uniref:Uncharacterized protein n=2 Tax=Rhizophagus irregularis TaxID=588596 RepID=U9T6B7_RHIID|nr:hypothetical protein GLOIN_2v1476994 [Rhizophagus irregularis DAOM 181602=DAOM 197198]EXX54187.1 hypothetical protein RirG_237080 [Rhizophagus irregularis DAOM 197198w]POG73375.1 hypothetical protein GLOIN_2v1476994 [Rhizophagus irregularis DAOM 181602=DAOM 197198]GBC45073.1 hypothetical protein GLOIN_2v1476994 [Rhizophagus irregularis DAOM 181602=DAOM 197198]CAG8556642.1 19633_t:CDS:1 [Rhizophagus irregularis]|eukprot:XP_025180241.1 hypothetical protein GLOIN_2v1476994 [Rhizophagus irregularis DAOM 181602=DAOM 197198]
MVKFNKRASKCKDDNQYEKLNKEMKQFIRKFPNTFESLNSYKRMALPKNASLETSNDTKEIEARPNKRDFARNTNLHPSHITGSPKRTRPPDFIDDSLEAGPSKF